MSQYKYGFCEWYLPFCGPHTLQFVKEMGYDGIQIGDMGGASQNFPLTNRRLALAYAEMAEKTGVEIQMLDILSVLNDGSLREDPDSALGKAALIAMEKAFEAAELMNVKAVFIPSVLKTRIENRYHLRNTIENLKRGKRLADDRGIEFLYESFSGVMETKKICKESGGIRLVYDTLNPLKYGFAEDAAEEIRAYGPEMIHTIHFKDINAAFSQDVAFTSGIGELKSCAEAIKEIGFSGWLVNENTYFRTEAVKNGADPWDLAAKDLETLKSIFEDN